ncbi:MAG: MerR family transcriptional regulator [Bacilli bacterium]|nr:MerR family transcriptional regulator [Bacilli bacterium]
MSYSISEVAKMLNVSTYTIRYYDKEGLFPLVKRVNGIRVFEDKDFPWLRMLNCLKNLNMPIKKIKEYVDLALKGDETLKERYDLILEQEESIEKQIKELKYYKKQIDFKKAYYEKALEAGTEEAVKDWPNPEATLDVDELPNKFRR